MQIVRVLEDLPDGFATLRAEAAAEGHRHMDRLTAEWDDDPRQFTALLAAFVDGELVGVGALTPEPAIEPGAAWRMRRLYVRPSARRRGVASALANALLTEALGLTRLVTVHAGSDEAGRFWESLGFQPVDERPWSHRYSAA
ncbi:MAG: GNAT family N-acetyltransferase [Phenylobacterium sp.]